MEKVKKIAKYVVNILGAISMLIVGIDAIEGISIPYAHQIVEVIVVVNGVIASYLLGQKAVSKAKGE